MRKKNVFRTRTKVYVNSEENETKLNTGEIITQ